MITKHKISVIIPNYNNDYWLSSCIDSCLNQKGNFDLEIIIIDDSSTDNSWEILSNFQLKYPEQIKIFKNPTKGGNHARNYGFSQSSGDYIQWLDSDDRLLEKKLEIQLEMFKKNECSDIVYSDWRMDFYEDSKKIKEKVIKQKEYPSFLIELLKNINWNCPNTYLMKREICELTIKNNGWSKTTKVGQDREFFTIAGILGGNFTYCEGIFSVYNRWSTQTVSHVSHISNIENSSILNQEFYTLIDSQDNIEKSKYHKILNTELIRNLFYHPKLVLPRTIKYKQVNWKDIDWKIRPLVTLLFIKKGLLNKKLKN